MRRLHAVGITVASPLAHLNYLPCYQRISGWGCGRLLASEGGTLLRQKRRLCSTVTIQPWPIASEDSS